MGQERFLVSTSRQAFLLVTSVSKRNWQIYKPQKYSLTIFEEICIQTSLMKLLTNSVDHVAPFTSNTVSGFLARLEVVPNAIVFSAGFSVMCKIVMTAFTCPAFPYKTKTSLTYLPAKNEGSVITYLQNYFNDKKLGNGLPT